MNFRQIYKICSPYTITSFARMEKLYKSVAYLNEKNIYGDYVECGVYKGGSVMNIALTQLNYTKKTHIHLYDTFEGMTAPGVHDINHSGTPAQRLLRQRPRTMCVCSLDEVKKNLALTGYPEKFLHYHKGDVADTLRSNIPEKVSLLRLDTDWYESTKIELEVLYPKLVRGGVLILDDYGYWKGARRATDEYFSAIGANPKFEPIEEGISAVSFIK